MQRLELAGAIETGGQSALRDRPVEVVRHVLFARPDQLDGNAGKLLCDGSCLTHVILCAAAATEAAAERMLVDLAFFERQAGLFR